MKQQKLLNIVIPVFCMLVFVNLCPSTAYTFFIDGKGFYSLSAETQTNPGGAKNLGTYQAILQNFSLFTEIKATDQLSMNLELKLFENPRTAFLGDTPKSQECVISSNSQNTTNQNCDNHYQSTHYPGYELIVPRISQAYARYALDYCILEVGRRARHWGNGIFLNQGDGPFDTASSIYDGINCHMNIQKLQTISINVGYDKLAETSPSIEVGLPVSNSKMSDGSTKKSDDINQFFVSIEYDDTKADPQANFNRKIGIYFANIVASPITEDSDSLKTDIKFLDLYLAFYWPRVKFSNELLLRLGKSADPTWKKYGGVSAQNGEAHRNDVSSLGFAGSLEFTLAQSGMFFGPKEYNEGTYKAHLLSIEYAYAPGDSDGYYDEYTQTTQGIYTIYELQRDTKAQAMAFHQNYKPALIMFNAHPILDNLAQDGIFDPVRVMNTTLLALGYRYEDINIGNFEIKLINAVLNSNIPSQLKTKIEENEALTQTKSKKPIGFYGKNLGYELDIKYNKNFGKNFALGIATAGLLPDKAWKVDDNNPSFSFLFQINTVLKF